MTPAVGIDNSSSELQRRRRHRMENGPQATSSLEEGHIHQRIPGLDDDVDTGSESRSASAEDVDELTSTGFEATFREHDAVSGPRPSDCGGDCPCERRRRSSAAVDRAAEPFPLPVVTSSSRTVVTCRTRASSPSSTGVGRFLLLLPTMWLPWLLAMTSLGTAGALPVVDSDASRAPVKVFDGSVNSADVDGPVI